MYSVKCTLYSLKAIDAILNSPHLEYQRNALRKRAFVGIVSLIDVVVCKHWGFGRCGFFNVGVNQTLISILGVNMRILLVIIEEIPHR